MRSIAFVLIGFLTTGSALSSASAALTTVDISGTIVFGEDTSLKFSSTGQLAGDNFVFYAIYDTDIGNVTTSPSGTIYESGAGMGLRTGLLGGRLNIGQSSIALIGNGDAEIDSSRVGPKISYEITGANNFLGMQISLGAFTPALLGINDPTDYAIPSGYGDGQFDIFGPSLSVDGVFNPTHLSVVSAPVSYLPDGSQALSGLPGGTLQDSTALPYGKVSSVSSVISGVQPDDEFYNFSWKGGELVTNGFISGADPASSFHFELFSPDNLSVPLADILLNAANQFEGTIDVSGLAAGSYEIGLSTDGAVDPDFTIDFATPVGIASVPEPATWSMMIVGLFGLGGMVRRHYSSLNAAACPRNSAGQCSGSISA